VAGQTACRSWHRGRYALTVPLIGLSSNRASGLTPEAFFVPAFTAYRSCALGYAIARPKAKLTVDAIAFVLPRTAERAAPLLFCSTLSTGSVGSAGVALPTTPTQPLTAYPKTVRTNCSVPHPPHRELFTGF